MGNPCQDFFRDNAEPAKELVPKLVESGQGLAFSKLSASEYSPGVVEAPETLCRQVVHPAFYDEANDEVTSTLYDDVCSRGLSTNRLKYGSRDEFVARGNNRLSEGRSVFGLVSFSREELEAIEADVNGIATMIRVFDTALQEDRSHADVCQTTGPTGKHALRKIRSAMFLKFKGRLQKV